MSKINHIGIVVQDIERALETYQEALGLTLEKVVAVPDQKVQVAFLPVGESSIELVQPLTADTGIARFLEKQGEGVHHICLEVEDIKAALAHLRELGVPLVDKAPRQGAHGQMAFVHPKGMHGVLIELLERQE
jgi:methylmalonyl-CoA epimerase